MQEATRNRFDWIFSEENAEQFRVADVRAFFDGSELFQTVLESIQDGVCVLDCEYAIQYVNTTMRRQYAHEKKVEGRKCYSAFHHRKKLCENCPTHRVFESKRPQSEIVEYQEGPEPGFHQIFAIPVLDFADNVILVIEYIRDITFQKKVESDMEDLKARFALLENQNALLMSLHEKTLRDRRELEETINGNIARYIKPAFEYLKKTLRAQDVDFVSGLFDEIVYPVTRKRPQELAAFTTREYQVAGLIKEGKSSKEIAQTLGISKKAVDNYRIAIRKKLSLSREDNLQTYLEQIYL